MHVIGKTNAFCTPFILAYTTFYARYLSNPTGPEWLGTTEAARRLGITTRTLYRFIDQGKLAAYRFGRVIRLKQGDVDTYIESCRIAPGTIAHLYPD